MDIITAYATQNDCYKKGQRMTPKGIVVHSTGANNPYLKRYVDAPEEVGVNANGNHWNQPGVSKCVHAFIGYDKNGRVRVANVLPYNYCCWGVGSGSKGSYNYDPAYIQFELCEDDLRNGAYFAEVYRTAVEYCVLLCRKFGLSPENIVSHREAHALGYGSNHGDPDNWWGNFGRTMDDFRSAVREELSAEEAPSAPEARLFRVQTGLFSSRADAEALAGRLTEAGFDASIVEETGEAPWTPAVGDRVVYMGSVHYRGANASAAYACTGGEAMITEICELGKSRHPYHLIHTGSGCTVYGYVDAGTFVKA